jgi:hypothetical protein
VASVRECPDHSGNLCLQVMCSSYLLPVGHEQSNAKMSESITGIARQQAETYGERYDQIKSSLLSRRLNIFHDETPDTCCQNARAITNANDCVECDD